MIQPKDKTIRIGEQVYDIKSRQKRNRFTIKLQNPFKKLIPNLSLEQPFKIRGTQYLVTGEFSDGKFLIKEMDGIDYEKYSEARTKGEFKYTKVKKKKPITVVSAEQTSEPTKTEIQKEN